MITIEELEKSLNKIDWTIKDNDNDGYRKQIINHIGIKTNLYIINQDRIEVYGTVFGNIGMGAISISLKDISVKEYYDNHKKEHLSCISLHIGDSNNSFINLYNIIL